MSDQTQPQSPSGASRRRIVVGAAWAVPVIGAAAAAPMAAASAGGTGGIYGRCDNGAAGHFELVVNGATPNSSLQVVVTHDGSSTAVNAVSASANWHLVGSSSNSYTFDVDVDATGHAGGVVNLVLMVPISGTVNVRGHGHVPGRTDHPAPQGGFAKTRAGSSDVYRCDAEDPLPA